MNSLKLFDFHFRTISGVAKFFYSFLFSIGSIVFCFGQEDPTSSLDTLLPTPQQTEKQLQQLNIESFKENKANYEFNVLLNRQNHCFNLLNEQIQKANSVLKEGIDYKGFTTELNLLVNWKNRTTKAIVKEQNKMPTVRDLTTSSILLNEILKRTQSQLEKISKNNTSLSKIQRCMDSLATDKVLYQVPNKEPAKRNYIQRMSMMSNDLKLVNNSLKNAIDSIQKLEVKGKLFKYSLESDLALINNARRELNEKIGDGIPDVITKNMTVASSKENFIMSLVKGYLVFVFYIANQIGILSMLMIFTLLLTIYLRMIRKKYKQAHMYENLKYPGHVLNYPFSAALLIMLTLFQFFIPSPPFVFTALLWILTGLALTYIMYKSANRYWFKIWLIIITLNFIAFFDNLLLLYTKGEDRFILIMSCIGLLLGTYVLINQHKAGRNFKEKAFAITFIMFMVFEALAFYFSLRDCYNLSKMLMVNGYFTLLIIYQLIWALGLSIDTFNFSKLLTLSEEQGYETKQKEDGKFTMPLLAYFLIIVGWYMLISRNTYNFQNYFGPIAEAYFEEKQFGEFKFSLHSIFLFFFIIFLSGLSARVVTLLASDPKPKSDGPTNSGLGSWMLLIRISLITIGVLIAFVSAGIPMDKIALMVSALSVGIGFGLQNVTNNLISGLIIAFEKPINLNDIVEIGGQTGKMKSIGIRSSVITTWDGADVIIPNGDLLSSHLINWTMGSFRRRFELDLGVAYGSDLKKVTEIIRQVLDQNTMVLKTPEPMVWLTKFNDSSIDFAIKFWVPHFNYGNDVKTDLIIEIDAAFRANGIEIPFPQRDLHIRSTVEAASDTTLDKP